MLLMLLKDRLMLSILLRLLSCSELTSFYLLLLMHPFLLLGRELLLNFPCCISC